MIYYEKNLKDIELHYLNDNVCTFVKTASDPTNLSVTNVENENNLSNINYVNEGPAVKTSLSEYFKTNNEKETAYKYIMKLRILLKHNEFKLNPENFRNRHIYFRPEFLIKYYMENITTNSTEDHSDSFLTKLRKLLSFDEYHSINKMYFNQMTNHFNESYYYYFINSLDTFFLKPYDSQTLTEVFHSYGINMFFLGKVAESTNAPHIRELCIIEMIARIIKKMLCDLMSQKLWERANDDFYIVNDHLKKNPDLDINSENYQMFIPVAFHLKYHKQYLKKTQVIPSITTDLKFSTENSTKTCKGVYKKYWYRSNFNDDKFFKTYALIGAPSTNKVDENNPNTAKNNEKNNPSLFNDINKEIAKFFNVLFNLEGGDDKDKKFEVNILNVSYKNGSLWKTILERVKHHYG